MEQTGKLLLEYGVLGVVVTVLATWMQKLVYDIREESKQREDRLASRVTRLEEFQETELLAIAKYSAEALAHNTEALNRTVETMDQVKSVVSAIHSRTAELFSEMKQRPCLLPQHEKEKD